MSLNAPEERKSGEADKPLDEPLLSPAARDEPKGDACATLGLPAAVAERLEAAAAAGDSSPLAEVLASAAELSRPRSTGATQTAATSLLLPGSRSSRSAAAAFLSKGPSDPPES